MSRAKLVTGTIDDLDDVVGTKTFDFVYPRKLLMYLDHPGQAAKALASRVTPGGLLSITANNTHGLAMRPALRGDGPGAIAAFVNEQCLNKLGVQPQELLDAQDQAGRTGPYCWLGSHLRPPPAAIALWVWSRKLLDPVANVLQTSEAGDKYFEYLFTLGGGATT